MGLTHTETDAMATAIYERSVAEARVHEASIDTLAGYDDGTMWIQAETRARAMSYAASELGCHFIDVQCLSRWMTVDLDAIRDRAHDLANDVAQGYDVEPEAIAYTWEGEGFLWSRCAKGDDGSRHFWECTER